ncbi:MAG: hypothetical protein KDA75_16505, partial [Planctomycetaceae bacterium]|nr:hypothetical protein [Planctomycetaceae bacterium]
MSTMIEPTRPASTPTETTGSDKPQVMLPDGRPNVALLEDQLPDWLKLSKHLAIFSGVIGLIFFSLNRLAIRQTDIWGHLSYGRWIAAQGELPRTEPLLELSQGVPWVDVAWLSKLSLLWMFEHFGVPGLQMLHAVTITIAFVALASLIYRKTGHLGWTLTGLLAFGVIDYQQLLIQRPQDFGVAAFGLVLLWGLSCRDRRFWWLALPLTFALWANVHGSFATGLVALGAVAVGRTIDVWRKTRSLRLTLRSGFVWRGVMMLELCATAALLNPGGIKV